MMIRKCVVLLLVMCISTSCAVYAPKKVKLPPSPIMKPVQVINKTISGKNVDNAIDNHISLWKYIKELQKLGSFKK